MPATPEAALRRIQDEREIERLLFLYAEMVDRREWKLADSVFALEATIDYSSTGGAAGPFREALAWLDLPDGERPGFVSVYFSEVDSEGHRHGIGSTEVEEAVERVDGYIARFMAGIAGGASPTTTVQIRWLNGLPAAVVTTEQGVVATLSLQVRGGRIRRVFSVRNPDKLEGL